jgi:hypothetical protein
MNTSLSMPKAGHILAKVSRTNPYDYFSSDIAHKILMSLGRFQLLKTWRAKATCFIRLASINPGLTFFEYVVKVGCDFSQASIVDRATTPSIGYFLQTAIRPYAITTHKMSRDNHAFFH